MSKISIITPAYNAAEFLEETIKSVQAQTYYDWEMIIVDDCSNDNTLLVAQEISKKDPRIKVFTNNQNKGVAFTRNYALEMASSDYIAFLDSDDLWLPRKLEDQIAFMEKGGYALTYTNYRKFDTVTKKQGKIIKAPAVMTAKKIYGNTSIGCLTVMVNRKLTGAFSMPLLHHTEDNITWQKILNLGFRGYRLDDVLALYREGNSSLTKSKKKAAKQQWQTYRGYYKFSICRSLYYFIQYTWYAVKKHFL